MTRQYAVTGTGGVDHRWFNAEKGMGFLTTADGKEIFVHASAISGSCNGTLREGQTLEFDVVVV